MIVRRKQALLSHLLLLSGSAVMLLPLFWMLSTSLKTYQETLINPPRWIPAIPQWQNYVEAWVAQPYMGRYFVNSFFTTMVTVVAEVVFSVLAAYAFARITFIGRSILFVLLLSTMMIPAEVLLIPNFITISRGFHWMDRYEALIIPWTVSVFAIFLIRQHFLQIPRELQEAAYLDGAGHTRFLFQIVLPLSRPPIATVALLKFISSWNAFLWPLIVTNSAKMRTISIGLMSFMEAEGPRYHLWMAAAAMALAPVLIVFLTAQNQLVESIAKSGLKG